MTYPIPKAPIEALYEVKKSKFYACAFPVKNREEAMAQLANKRREYPDARHHCWAYLLGNPLSPASAAMSDDGEPSGTAGKPILNVLQHKGIGDIMIVVTRYFGGIKLGAGGLVRAYSAATQQVMELLETVEQVQRIDITLALDFKHEQFFRNWASQNDAVVTNCLYTHEVAMTLGVLAPTLSSLQALAANMSVSVCVHE